MTNKSLTITNQKLTPQVWEMIQDIAPIMQASRLFNVPSPEAAAAIMLKGYELGFSLTASFEFIAVVDGKPTLSPRGALALVQQSPEFVSMDIQDDGKTCTVTMRRINGIKYTTSFGMDDAKLAGLIKKDGAWEKYPANMRKWRAIGFAIDVVFPDIIGGMKRSDEFGADITVEGDVNDKPMPMLINEDSGEVILTTGDVVVLEQDQQMAEATPDIPNYNITSLSQLLELASDEVIQDAFEFVYGERRFPIDETEINFVVHRLMTVEILYQDADGKIWAVEVKKDDNKN